MDDASIQLVLCDVGGVVLSNGWDTRSRQRVTEELGLDWEEFNERHDFIVDRFETGRIELSDYIGFTVMHRPRDFTLNEFADRMRAQSAPNDGGLELAADLAGCGLKCVTLNNESRPLNDHRVATFGLARFFDAFFTSGYLGVKKPDDAIYRIAAEVSGVSPGQCVFIDDRAHNLEPAAEMGMHTIHHVDAATTRQALATIGVALPDRRDDS